MEKNKMGGTCSAYGDRRGLFRVFGGGTRGKEGTWETHA
jgi:hypothetical protein